MDGVGSASASAVAGYKYRFQGSAVATDNIDIVANVATVTVASTALYNTGDSVTISGVTGNVSANGNILTDAQELALNASHTITVVNANNIYVPNFHDHNSCQRGPYRW